MAHYIHNRRPGRHKKLIVSVMVLLILVVIGVAVGFGMYISRSSSKVIDDKAVGKEVTVGYFAPSTQIHTSNYFQFQTNKYWSQAINESTQNKFVYRYIRDTLIDHELVIYVDQIPEQLAASRVLPVKITNDKIVPSDVSDRCGKKVANRSLPVQKNTEFGTTFDCSLSDGAYTVIVGVQGGSTTVRLPRPNKQVSVYSFYYRNVTANPDVSQLKDILDTFQTR